MHILPYKNEERAQGRERPPPASFPSPPLGNSCQATNRQDPSNPILSYDPPGLSLPTAPLFSSYLSAPWTINAAATPSMNDFFIPFQ
mmetsp:Transcript_47547/g.64737  ORF Transcript_47547/g.64737 Transcript_47547/m.64737 type:complete len:87 (+) Transcript_47547:324-584(+)